MKKILIIEDEVDLREAVLSRLLSEGYDVKVAETAEIGLQLVMQSKPDIILLDVLTHSLHGSVFMQRLRQLPEGMNNSKVIVLTNLDNDITREKLDPHNIDAYMVKAEVSLDAVTEKVKEVLGEENTNQGE